MKTYCLLNHKLTENQEKELSEKFQSEKIVYPSAELSASWAQVPPTERIDHGIARRVVDWLSDAEEGDILLVQGEMGATFLLVSYALSHGLVPMHAVSRREESESVEGESVVKRHIFRHVCFRRYEIWDEE